MLRDHPGFMPQISATPSVTDKFQLTQVNPHIIALQFRRPPPLLRFASPEAASTLRKLDPILNRSVNISTSTCHTVLTIAQIQTLPPSRHSFIKRWTLDLDLPTQTVTLTSYGINDTTSYRSATQSWDLSSINPERAYIIVTPHAAHLSLYPPRYTTNKSTKLNETPEQETVGEVITFVREEDNAQLVQICLRKLERICKKYKETHQCLVNAFESIKEYPELQIDHVERKRSEEALAEVQAPIEEKDKPLQLGPSTISFTKAAHFLVDVGKNRANMRIEEKVISKSIYS